MAGMLKQAQKMQEDMAAKQAELEEATYEVSAGGGMVTVRINGKKEILSMDVKPDIVDPDDIETMTDIIVAAVNEAVRKVEDIANEEMAKITGQMSLPGMPGMF
jgi:DNA-binding YbaB/EbfC family protein